MVKKSADKKPVSEINAPLTDLKILKKGIARNRA
jgi:hypothetical protein